MSDRISIIYDANVDALNNKLNEIIQKNILVKGSVDEATKSLKNMADALQKHASKVQINIDNSQDFRNILNEVTKVTVDNREITKTSTSTTEKNTQATEKSTKTKNEQSRALKVNTNNAQDNSIHLTQNNKVHHDFSRTLSQTTNNITRLNSKFIENNKILNDNSSRVTNITDSYNRYGGGIGRASLAGAGLAKVLSLVGNRLIAAFAIERIMAFSKGVVDVERKLEIVKNRFDFIYDSSQGGTNAMERFRDAAMRLGLDITTLTEGFTGFAIASKAAGFSADQSEKMFIRVATAIRASGGTALQQQRAFLALQQMLSKGVVSAEELRRQLAEAMPNATEIMIRAYNKLHPAQELTSRQFIKLMEEGKILSAEILPAFSEELEKEMAPALSGKANSLDAAFQRVSTSFTMFRKNLAEALPLKQMVNAFSGFFDDINVIIESNADIPKKIALLFGSTPLSRLFFNKEYRESINELKAESAEIQQMDEFAEKMRRKNAKERVFELEKEGKSLDQIQEIIETDILNAREQVRQKTVQVSLIRKSVNALEEAGEYNRDMVKATQETIPGLKRQIKEQEQIVDNEQFRLAILKQIREERKKAAPEPISDSEAEAKKLKSVEEAMFKAKNAVEEAIVAGDSLENQEKLMTDYIDKMAAYKILKDKAGAEESKNIRIQAEKEVALFALKIDLDLLKAQKANLQMEGQSVIQITKDIADKQAQIDVLGAQSQAESLREQAEANLAFREQELKEELEIRTKDLTSFIATQQEKIDATKEGSKERLDLELSVLKAQEMMEYDSVRFSLKSREDKQIETNKIFAKYTKLRRQLTEKYNADTEQEAQKSQDRIVDILQKANDLIERNEGDSFNKRIARTKQMFEKMAREIKDAMSQTGDLDLLGKLTKALGEVEVAGKKATDSIELERASEIIGGAANVYSEITKLQSTAYDNEEIALKRQLEQKLISEQEYERKAAELAKKRFEHEKKAATVSAIIDGALGVMKAIGKGRWWEVAAITAATGIQIATIQSQQFPGFKEGVIDLQGPGTATSDSIPARLSRGESVMTAEETTKYKPVLQAIRDNEFEAFVAKRYTDVMRKQSGNAGLGSSFAENVSNSFDMQTAELATLLKQNRRVAIKNVDEFAKAISRRSTTDKVINRRRFK